MDKKAFTVAVMVLALLIAMPARTLLVNKVSAQSAEVITIKPDGTINPSTAPIAKIGNVYKMTGNISASVTVQKSNIIFDGDGYTIQSPGWSWALKLSPPTPIEPGLTNITVRNVNVIEDPNASAWAWGIMLDSTTNSVIANSTVSNIRDSLGIWIQDFSTGNTIIGNNLTNVYRSAIAVWSRGNIVIGNRITSSGTAIDISSTYDNIIFGNSIENNHVGIHCWAGNPLPPGVKNFIYYNNFINNNLTFLNEAIFISGTGVLLYPAIVNIWDNSTKGNYWSDYNGTDTNGDGIGDTPYFIDDHYNIEGANDTDHYPLMNPVNITSITTYTPSSLPVIPELTPIAAVAGLVVVTCMLIIASKRKTFHRVEMTVTSRIERGRIKC